VRGQDSGQTLWIGCELVVPDLLDLAAEGQALRSFQLKGFSKGLSFVVYLKGLLLFHPFLLREFIFPRAIPKILSYFLQMLPFLRVNKVYLTDFCLSALLDDRCQLLSELFLLQSLKLVVYNYNELLP
jgi:hypothetical protein